MIWHEFKKDKPQATGLYLVYAKGHNGAPDEMLVAKYVHGSKAFFTEFELEDAFTEITHWMELPEPPGKDPCTHILNHVINWLSDNEPYSGTTDNGIPYQPLKLKAQRELLGMMENQS